MNKKLLLVAMATVLSVSGVYASDITGITPSGNTYNINPDKINGEVGYRQYDNFNLTEGDIANLIFHGKKGNSERDVEAFINLVKNGVNINGLLNTVGKDGNFYDGHAIFVTPGGFVVGASGVLNVGRLSVATPTASTYDGLIEDYAKGEYTNINQVSKLKQDSNAAVTIDGKVLARRGVDLRGSEVAVNGTIVNGVSNNSVFSTLEDANTLFNSLVNTNGLSTADATALNNGSIILIKSSKDGGLTVGENAVIANKATGANTGVYLTNNGTKGMTVNGAVSDNAFTRLYNAKGDLTVGGSVRAAKVDVLNKGGALTLTDKSSLSGNRVEVFNKGTGALTTAGEITGHGAVAVKNFTGSGMTVNGTITNDGTDAETAINNLNGEMLVGATIDNHGNMGINNKGSKMTIAQAADITNAGKLKITNTGFEGMTVAGKVENTGATYIYNDGGKLTFASPATVTNHNDNLYIASRDTATGIDIQKGVNISNENGNLAIRNKSGADGLNIAGSVANKNGTTAINNDKGNLNVSGDVSVENGNLGIINRANGGSMFLSSESKISVTGESANANIKNYGLGDMTVNSEITHTGRMNVIANSGALTLGSTVHNNSGVLNDNGGFYATARQNGTGVKVTSEFVVDGNGEVLIKNISGEDGLEYNGTINTTGHQAALVNKKGAMKVNGNMTTKDAPIIISNQGTSMEITEKSKLTSGTEGKVVNTGTEAAKINGSLTNIKKYEKVRK